MGTGEASTRKSTKLPFQSYVTPFPYMSSQTDEEDVLSFTYFTLPCLSSWCAHANCLPLHPLNFSHLSRFRSNVASVMSLLWSFRSTIVTDFLNVMNMHCLYSMWAYCLAYSGQSITIYGKRKSPHILSGCYMLFFVILPNYIITL